MHMWTSLPPDIPDEINHVVSWKLHLQMPSMSGNYETGADSPRGKG